MNSSTTKVYRNSKFIECKWGEVLVGDLVKVGENETFPADTIVLNTSNEGYLFKLNLFPLYEKF